MSLTAEPTGREITIATTLDDAWVPHFATCATSVADSRGRESVRFLMLQGPSLSDAAVGAMRDYVRSLGMEFESVRVSAAVDESLPPSLLFSRLCWYRPLLPELLPDLDRVLALDADTLVLQSLAPLYEREFGENLLLAVVGENSRARMTAVGEDPSLPYFNAGVMLMNLKAMRAEQFGPRAIELGHERFEEFIFVDQDAMNSVAAGRWGPLHPRWNAMSHFYLTPHGKDHTYSAMDQAVARLSPAVVHFEGFQTVKPWFYRSVHPLRFLYRDYRARTPWPLGELERKSMGGAVLRVLPIRVQYAIAIAKNALVGRLKRR